MDLRQRHSKRGPTQHTAREQRNEIGDPLARHSRGSVRAWPRGAQRFSLLRPLIMHIGQCGKIRGRRSGCGQRLAFIKIIVSKSPIWRGFSTVELGNWMRYFFRCSFFDIPPIQRRYHVPYWFYHINSFFLSIFLFHFLFFYFLKKKLSNCFIR